MQMHMQKEEKWRDRSKQTVVSLREHSVRVLENVSAFA